MAGISGRGRVSFSVAPQGRSRLAGQAARIARDPVRLDVVRLAAAVVAARRAAFAGAGGIGVAVEIGVADVRACATTMIHVRRRAAVRRDAGVVNQARRAGDVAAAVRTVAGAQVGGAVTGRCVGCLVATENAAFGHVCSPFRGSKERSIRRSRSRRQEIGFRALEIGGGRPYY
ncbi:hypothetical protein ebA1188 [Aromatoleum aromaticum EbN1]|uniref:Uncharacterized protein n=1 Tax=Aromatoleum aromaticum (strain DSM 19018 / LMG 30748 / EbN1) TaxID=76114 RepID=Q5P7G0_AROAE|nr:hypothetical protein ebA1188 [Aromatoleum aromaticum EbN1]